MRTKFKAWTEPYIKEHLEVGIDIPSLASFNKPYYLEIGSGKGQFILDMALKFPNKTFIGVERNVTCAGFTAKKLVDNKIENAKIMWENADNILIELKDNSVEGIFLNFSDPWPKKRHAKRRLTADRYLSSYFRILKPGSKLIIKTDQKDLYDFTLENLETSPFKLISKTENYQNLDEFDTVTEYEADFRKEGLPIYRIILEK